jgi:hypothetical protein
MSDLPGGPTPPPPPPPPGTPPGAGGLRPRTLGEILSAAFEIYKANASKLLVIVALVVVPLSLIGALVGEALEGETTTDEFGNVQIESQDLLTFFLGLAVVALVYVIISAILQAAMMRAAALATIGDPVDVEGSYRWGLGRFGAVILVALLVGLAIFVGIFLVFIGAIIFATFLAVSIPALVIENRRGTDALKRSWNLVSGSFWHVLGVIIVSALITGLVSGLIGGIGGDNWFVAWIFTAIAQIVTAPYAALVSVLLYLDLRARKEALTADSLRGELASNA